MTRRLVLAGVLVALASVQAQAQAVKVEFLMGKVNLAAQNASLRAILTEWSRVGGTRLVNPERLTGAPITLELVGVPERQALDILLREVGGYMLGPRATLVPGVSAFDRLVVVTAVAGRQTTPPPSFSPARPTPPISRVAPPIEPDDDVEEDEDEDEPDDEPIVGPGARGRGVPALRPSVPPLPALPRGTEPATGPRSTPGNPFGITPGSARPGTIAPAPQPSENLPGESDSERALRDRNGQ